MYVCTYVCVYVCVCVCVYIYIYVYQAEVLKLRHMWSLCLLLYRWQTLQISYTHTHTHTRPRAQAECNTLAFYHADVAASSTDTQITKILHEVLCQDTLTPPWGLNILTSLVNTPPSAAGHLQCLAAVGLLTGHTSLWAHLYKLGHTEGQECRLCGHDKEDSVHIVCDCPVLACKRCRILGCMLLMPQDLDKVRVSSLLSLLAITGLGLVS